VNVCCWSRLCENTQHRPRTGLSDLIGRYEFLRGVRGKGLMIGIELGPH
jgi:acetylornithine/succinyldiaminopimelate/putrescine aminotransferase